MSRNAESLLGVLVLLAGGGIMAVGAGLFPSAIRGAHAPLWVIFAAGSLFALAGLSLLAKGRLPEPLLSLLGCIAISLFALIFGWIALGDGPRLFSVSISAGWAAAWQTASAGRMAFGLGAALMALMALMALIAWARWFGSLNWTGRAVAVMALTVIVWLARGPIPAEPDWPDVADDHERLARYALMIEDEGWMRNKGRGPAQWYYPPWHDIESWIKQARARLAAARTPPAGAAVARVPLTAQPPTIDGQTGDPAWRDALHIDLEPADQLTRVHLVTDGAKLYLAAEVPGDTTEKGFDQFRFWFHIRLSPWLENERAHVDGSGAVNVLRAMRFPWGEHVSRHRTDWHTHQRAVAAASLFGHRRYELALDLEESGIAPGVPFPAWIDIEGDPVRDSQGKFKARTVLGRKGSQETPLWLVISPSERKI